MSRITRCKLKLNTKTENIGGADNPLTRLAFGAVYSNVKTDEDAVFGKFTPYADFVVNIASENAAHFEQGKSYYVDIHEVPEPVEA